jgi:tol-pal system protein YbgF
MTQRLHERRVLNFTRFAGALFVCTLFATPAFAVNKDMVQLQTEVQDLQEAVAHLQQSNDERMGVLKDLVQQTADSVNKMSVTVETLQRQMRTEQEASISKLDQVSGQVQSLNDSLDELKARLNAMEKALQSVQNQQQSINAALQNIAQPAGSAPVTAAGPPPAGIPAATDQAVGNNGNPSSDNSVPAAEGAPVAAPDAPATAAIYKAALGDYEAAKYALATQGFNQVVRSDPANSLAGNAYYYLGEIDYRSGKFAAAVNQYDHVLAGYPGNPKIPVSHLHKGMALLALKDRDGGITEFRTLIQRFPNSPEATQARSKLAGMGVPRAAPRSE